MEKQITLSLSEDDISSICEALQKEIVAIKNEYKRNKDSANIFDVSRYVMENAFYDDLIYRIKAQAAEQSNA